MASQKKSVCCARVGICILSHLFLIVFLVMAILIIVNFSFGSPPKSVTLREIPPDSSFAGVSADNLSDAASYIWLQPSDIHIRDNHTNSVTCFREFCSSVLPYIKPE